MGNAVNSLPFEIGAQVEYCGNLHWQLNVGYRKDDSKVEREEVSLFRFSKTQSDKLVVAQRCQQKIRTLKHPSVLTFVDSTELEDQLILVTEPCVPLSTWIKEHVVDLKSEEDKQLLFEEALWGFKCIISALSFLHSAASMTHGYIGPHAIFICKTGDWKLGALDLASNIDLPVDRSFCLAHSHLLSTPYQAPERSPMTEASLLAPKGSCDIFALGKVIELIADDIGYAIPATVQRCIQKMVSSGPKQRPSADALLLLPMFNSDHIHLLASLGDLSIRPIAESVQIITSLTSRTSMIPKPVCAHKIIPALSRVLQMAVNDFSNRDNRETSRQAIHQALSLLADLSGKGKVDETVFNSKCLSIVISLWGMTDRAVRTTLLKTCRHIFPLIADSVFNKSIFDSMLSGFADSNSKMREETLKSLIHAVDKLDEKHLQDKLVRCITSLQADAENSIRTNVTIFLGRIAPKLNEGPRNRVLCPSFQKAMRDNFMHCRIAGLRATGACLSLLEPTQIGRIIMPQLCMLVIDRNSDVRELALSTLEQCLPVMKKEQIRMSELEKTAKELSPNGQGSGLASATAPAASSFLSWAVDGLSRGLEKAAIPSSNPAASAVDSAGSSLSSLDSLSNASSSVTEASRSAAATVLPKKSSMTSMDSADGGWDDFDLGDIDDRDGGDESDRKPPASSQADGWGDDFDVDFDDSAVEVSAAASSFNYKDDDDDDAFAKIPVKVLEPKVPKMVSAPVASPIESPNASVRASASASASTNTSASTSASSLRSKTLATAPTSAVKKIAVTKLAMDKSDWDDF